MESGRVLRNILARYPDVNTLTSEIVFLRRTNYIRLLSYQGHSLLYPRLVAGTVLGYTSWIRHEDVVKDTKVKNVYFGNLQLRNAPRAHTQQLIFQHFFFLIAKRLFVCNLEYKNGKCRYGCKKDKDYKICHVLQSAHITLLINVSLLFFLDFFSPLFSKFIYFA